MMPYSLLLEDIEYTDKYWGIQCREMAKDFDCHWTFPA